MRERDRRAKRVEVQTVVEWKETESVNSASAQKYFFFPACMNVSHKPTGSGVTVQAPWRQTDLDISSCFLGWLQSSFIENGKIQVEMEEICTGNG